MPCTRNSYLCLVALLALSAFGEAQLQLNTFNMSRAVEVLAERFQQIADDGLGIDALKVSIWILFGMDSRRVQQL